MPFIQQMAQARDTEDNARSPMVIHLMRQLRAGRVYCDFETLPSGLLQGAGVPQLTQSSDPPIIAPKSQQADRRWLSPQYYGIADDIILRG
jgi:hypothetical protein